MLGQSLDPRRALRITFDKGGKKRGFVFLKVVFSNWGI